VNWFHLVQNEI